MGEPPKGGPRRRTAAQLTGDDAEAARAMRYAATVAHLDDAIGRVIAVLEANRQRENTLVVFTSDNGPQIVPRDPTQNGGTAGELRGFKGTTYEGGIRVPALVSWPARLKPRKLETPVLVVDWLPTFAALAGITVKTGRTLDGVDVWPLLTGSVATLAPRPLYLKYLGGMAALREGDWKLVTRGESRFARSLMVGDDRADQLFNLTADPLERDELAATRPEILARMQARLIEHMEGDAPAFADGTMQYWWSRVPEQQALIARRTAEVTAERAKQKSAAPR